MEKLLFIIIGILLLIILALVAKIYFLHKSAREITEAFRDRLTTDTNTLIDISARDPHMRKLAADINVQLRLLRRERQCYQQGDLELKEAVTNISHDIRTPLTAIGGYLDLLEREDINENAKRYFSQIRNRTEVLISLTEELFGYSVITSPHELKKEKLDVVRVLEESLLSFYAVMKERGIEPEIELPTKPVIRELDKSAVNRIFSNIISNALKYSDGDLAVSMNDSCEIVFSNTASNLDTVTAGRLFERFFTVESGKNRTGLGLSIAKTLTERMDGRIDISFEYGKLQIKTEFT